MIAKKSLLKKLLLIALPVVACSSAFLLSTMAVSCNEKSSDSDDLPPPKNYIPIDDYEFGVFEVTDNLQITGIKQEVIDSGELSNYSSMYVPATYDGISIDAINTDAFVDISVDNPDYTHPSILPDSITTVVFGRNVMTLGPNAFTNSKIKKVYFNKNLERVDSCCFKQCHHLTYFNLSDINLEYIGPNAFQGCQNLQWDAYLPDSITEVGEDAFRYCDSVSYDVLHDVSPTPAGSHGDNPPPPQEGDLLSSKTDAKHTHQWFMGLPDPENPLYTPNTETSIFFQNSDESVAFNFYGAQDASLSRNQNLEMCVIPKSMVYLGMAMFADCPVLENVLFHSGNACTVIPYGFLEYYKDQTADRPSSMTHFSIPDNITSIGAFAFVGQSFHDMYVPASVKTIGGEAFAYCLNLEHVTLNEGLNDIEPGAFGYAAINTITIPATVRKIGDGAFSMDKYLRTMVWQTQTPSLTNTALGIIVSDHDFSQDATGNGSDNRNDMDGPAHALTMVIPAGANKDQWLDYFGGNKKTTEGGSAMWINYDGWYEEETPQDPHCNGLTVMNANDEKTSLNKVFGLSKINFTLPVAHSFTSTPTTYEAFQAIRDTMNQGGTTWQQEYLNLYSDLTFDDLSANGCKVKVNADSMWYSNETDDSYHDQWITVSFSV